MGGFVICLLFELLFYISGLFSWFSLVLLMFSSFIPSSKSFGSFFLSFRLQPPLFAQFICMYYY